MTLDECIGRLEVVRQILGGAASVTVTMAEDLRSERLLITLAESATWVKDCELGLTFAPPRWRRVKPHGESS